MFRNSEAIAKAETSGISTNSSPEVSPFQNTRSVQNVRINEDDLAVHSGINVRDGWDFDKTSVAGLPLQVWDETDVSRVEDCHAGRVIVGRLHVVRLEG